MTHVLQHDDSFLQPGNLYGSTNRLEADLFTIIVCKTPLLLFGWLHNCTYVDEAPDQNGGEIAESPTSTSPKSLSEAGGMVAGRPKASR